MSTATSTSPREAVAREFDNGAEFLHSIGDVPMSRVIWNPRPGTATEKDLLLFVERDKRLCELIDGTLVEKPMGTYESFLAGWVMYYLNAFLELNPIGIALGEAGLLRLTSGRIRAPDVSFIRDERIAANQLETQRVLALGPDLAVEVISDGITVAEMRQKMEEYFQSGAKLVWLVYPRAKTVEVYTRLTDAPDSTLTQSDTVRADELLPGFSLELHKLFSKRPM